MFLLHVSTALNCVHPHRKRLRSNQYLMGKFLVALAHFAHFVVRVLGREKYIYNVRITNNIYISTYWINDDDDILINLSIYVYSTYNSQVSVCLEHHWGYHKSTFVLCFVKILGHDFFFLIQLHLPTCNEIVLVQW